MLFDGLTYVPFFWVRSYPLALALVFVHGLCIPAIVVARTSLLQQHVGDARAGKVFALVYLTVSGMTALSAIVAGAIAARHGAPMLFLLAGGFGTIVRPRRACSSPRRRGAAVRDRRFRHAPNRGPGGSSRRVGSSRARGPCVPRSPTAISRQRRGAGLAGFGSSS